jgi:hypothetical protein
VLVLVLSVILYLVLSGKCNGRGAGAGGSAAGGGSAGGYQVLSANFGEATDDFLDSGAGPDSLLIGSL